MDKEIMDEKGNVNKGNWPDVIFLLVVGFFVGLLIGVFIGIQDGRSQVRTEALQHNCAQYDSQTGKFMWKETK